MEKTCTKCGETKAIDLFPANKSAKDGRRADCKKCRQAWQKAHLAKKRPAKESLPNGRKRCTGCKVILLLTNFSKTRRAKTGLESKCRSCRSIDRAAPQAQSLRKAYRTSNRETMLEDGRRWNKANLGKKRAARALHRARTAERVPVWLTSAHHAEFVSIYDGTPEGHQVDHDVPLLGVTVSGLHVPWNLQYLPTKENQRKRWYYPTDDEWTAEELIRLFSPSRGSTGS